jgi:hypothetical protein
MVKNNKSDNDKFYTPPDIVDECLKMIDFENCESICDPSAGNKEFYNKYPEHIKKDYYELDENKDFLKCNYKYDWIISNIPFSIAGKFILKMAECANIGFGVLCLASHITPTRIKKIEDMGFNITKMKRFYIKEWGFGYITDFYVFEKSDKKLFETIIREK